MESLVIGMTTPTMGPPLPRFCPDELELKRDVLPDPEPVPEVLVPDEPIPLVPDDPKLLPEDPKLLLEEPKLLLDDPKLLLEEPKLLPEESVPDEPVVDPDDPSLPAGLAA